MKKPKSRPAKPHASIRGKAAPPSHPVPKHQLAKGAPKHPVRSPTPNRRGA